TFNLDQLSNLLLREAALREAGDLIKVLGRGEVKGPVTVSAHKFSGQALKKIEAAGGKAIVLNA
ncbi:mitochondrial large ribosomal subunit protein uL15m, partial [Candidatus Saganbacteria bacterium]|nr:mitochondrial large ribosomal subunit protein uL15m [Candidatus Saganbacteria bacterium]